MPLIINAMKKPAKQKRVPRKVRRAAHVAAAGLAIAPMHARAQNVTVDFIREGGGVAKPALEIINPYQRDVHHRQVQDYHEPIVQEIKAPTDPGKFAFHQMLDFPDRAAGVKYTLWSSKGPEQSEELRKALNLSEEQWAAAGSGKPRWAVTGKDEKGKHVATVFLGPVSEIREVHPDAQHSFTYTIVERPKGKEPKEKERSVTPGTREILMGKLPPDYHDTVQGRYEPHSYTPGNEIIQVKVFDPTSGKPKVIIIKGLGEVPSEHRPRPLPLLKLREMPNPEEGSIKKRVPFYRALLGRGKDELYKERRKPI